MQKSIASISNACLNQNFRREDGGTVIGRSNSMGDGDNLNIKTMTPRRAGKIRAEYIIIFVIEYVYILIFFRLLKLKNQLNIIFIMNFTSFVCI